MNVPTRQGLIAGAGLGALGGGLIYHPAIGQAQYEVTDLPWDADGQVEQTIQLMKQYAIEDAWSQEVQGELAKALANQPPAQLGDREVTERVWRYVKGRMRFANDNVIASPLEGVIANQRGGGMLDGDKGGEGDYIAEVLIRPRDMAPLPVGVGDCDDYSMLVASMLTAAGVGSAYVTVAADPRIPDTYSHVYVAAYPVEIGGRKRLAMDCSHGTYCGWEVPDRLGKSREWKVTEGGGGLGLGWLGTSEPFTCMCITAPCNCAAGGNGTWAAPGTAVEPPLPPVQTINPTAGAMTNGKFGPELYGVPLVFAAAAAFLVMRD